MPNARRVPSSIALRPLAPLLTALAIAAYAWLSPSSANAVPAWSRRYAEPKTDCWGCHNWGGWQLNKMGRDFLRYGHMFEGEEPKLGLSEYTSFSVKSRYTGGTNEGETFLVDSFSIYTGGPLGKGFSYFVEAYVHEASGKNSGPSQLGNYGRSKLAEGFLQYTYGREEHYATVRFGQTQPSLLHQHNFGARNSLGRPFLWNRAVINPDNAYRPFSRQYGADVGYHLKGLHVAAGVLNGTGSILNAVDNNAKKDFFASVDYTIGRLGSNLGVLYYRGAFPIADAMGNKLYDDDFSRIILVGNLVLPYVSVMGAIVRGWDEVDASGKTARGTGGYLQPFVSPWRRFGAFARFEVWNPRNDVSGDMVRGFTAGATVIPFDYGRFVLDVAKYGSRDKPGSLTWMLEGNFLW